MLSRRQSPIRTHVLRHALFTISTRRYGAAIQAAGTGAGAVQQKAESDNWLDIGSKFRRRAMLWWPGGRPERVLIVKKRHDSDAKSTLVEIAAWLQEQNIEALVEPNVHEEECPHLAPWTKKLEPPDFCVTLGGDGTVLHTASLFNEASALPPMLAFAMGSLGFLTPFSASTFKPLLTRVIGANERAVFTTLRARLACEVYCGDELAAAHQAFNEACLDRGLGLNFLQMDCYIDGSYVTTIQGDGLLISTPSGSTAYNLSAGGPMVAPSVPCVLITPIAPHTLSFRPVVVAETSDIVIHIPADFSHEGARVSFDGKNTNMLQPGDSVRMTLARWPLPMITAETLDRDWFDGITEKLHWNNNIKDIERSGAASPLPAILSMDTCDDDGCLAAAPRGGDVPQCVRPNPGNLMACHHMGQAVSEIYDGMPLYCPTSESDSESDSGGSAASSMDEMQVPPSWGHSISGSGRRRGSGTRAWSYDDAASQNVQMTGRPRIEAPISLSQEQAHEEHSGSSNQSSKSSRSDSDSSDSSDFDDMPNGAKHWAATGSSDFEDTSQRQRQHSEDAPS